MSLGQLYQLFQIIVGGGLGAIVLGFVYRQKKIIEERDRLLAEQKREKLKNDEKEISNKIDSMPLADLVNSAAVNRSGNDSE